jgi:hypothetical protein
MIMKASELPAKLTAAGCNQFCVGDCFQLTDLHCLDYDGQNWHVFYTERGKRHDPIFSSPSEDEASRFYYQFITRMTHWHLVGFFEQERAAFKLEEKLHSLEIATRRNDIPAYSGPNDPRFRVFVVGKDIFRARAALGDLPKKDGLEKL